MYPLGELQAYVERGDAGWTFRIFLPRAGGLETKVTAASLDDFAKSLAAKAARMRSDEQEG